MNEQARPQNQEDEHGDRSCSRGSMNSSCQIATTDSVVDQEARTQTNWQRQPTSSISTDFVKPVGTAPVYIVPAHPVLVEVDTDENQTGQSSSKSTRGDKSTQTNPQVHEVDEEKPQSTTWATMAGALVVGLIIGLGGAWAYSHFMGSDKDKNSDSTSSKTKQNSSSPKDSASKSQDSSGSGASDMVGFGSASEVRDLHAKLAEISERIDRLTTRVDRMKSGESAPPAGLSTLQIRVGELSREVDDVAYLPEQVRRMENEIEALKQKARTRDDLQPTPSSSAQPSPTVRETPRTDSPTSERTHQTIESHADEPVVIDLNQTSSAMDQGLQLLQEGRPIVALGILRALEAKRPGDARILYLTALATGAATEDWNGEARRLVDRGMALERSGSPSSKQVELMLEQLQASHVRGVDWLNAYRHPVVLRN